MTSEVLKAPLARPGRTAIALILSAVAVLNVGCGAQFATVRVPAVPSAPQPQPPGMDAKIEGAHGPTECSEDAPEGRNTAFDPRKSSLHPPSQMPEPKFMPKGSTMERIVQRGTLVAAVDQNIKRFSSINPHNGRLEGFEIDLMREIASALFGDPSKVQFRIVNFSNQFDVLNGNEPDGDKKPDILANSITITCERRYKHHVWFTSYYFVSHQRVMVSKHSRYQQLEDLQKRRVCAPNKTTSIGKIINTDGLIPVAVVELADCLVLLQQGQVDAISTDDSTLIGLIDQDPTMHMVGLSLTDEPLGLVIREEEEDFVRFVNGVLERLRSNGTWRLLYQRWFTDLSTDTPDPPVAEYLN